MWWEFFGSTFCTSSSPTHFPSSPHHHLPSHLPSPAQTPTLTCSHNMSYIPSRPNQIILCQPLLLHWAWQHAQLWLHTCWGKSWHSWQPIVDYSSLPQEKKIPLLSSGTVVSVLTTVMIRDPCWMLDAHMLKYPHKKFSLGYHETAWLLATNGPTTPTVILMILYTRSRSTVYNLTDFPLDRWSGESRLTNLCWCSHSP